MPTRDPTRNLTITDIAGLLSMSRYSVARLVNSGALPTIQGPGRWPQIPVAAFLTWLSGQVVTPSQKDGDMTALPTLIPIETVAETYRLSLRSLKDGARSRRFRHIQIGRGRYFTADQLDEFLAARTVATAMDDTKDAMRERRSRRQARPRRATA